jgi:hypothetical protein
MRLSGGMHGASLQNHYPLEVVISVPGCERPQREAKVALALPLSPGGLRKNLFNLETLCWFASSPLDVRLLYFLEAELCADTGRRTETPLQDCRARLAHGSRLVRWSQPLTSAYLQSVLPNRSL